MPGSVDRELAEMKVGGKAGDILFVGEIAPVAIILNTVKDKFIQAIHGPCFTDIPVSLHFFMPVYLGQK